MDILQFLWTTTKYPNFNIKWNSYPCTMYIPSIHLLPMGSSLCGVQCTSTAVSILSITGSGVNESGIVTTGTVEVVHFKVQYTCLSGTWVRFSLLYHNHSVTWHPTERRMVYADSILSEQMVGICTGSRDVRSWMKITSMECVERRYRQSHGYVKRC